MSKLKLLQVTGSASDYYVNVQRLVSVLNDAEFIACIRMQAFREAQEAHLTEEQQADIIRSLHVQLLDTGLDEYPEDNNVVAEIYRDFLFPTTCATRNAALAWSATDPPELAKQKEE